MLSVELKIEGRRRVKTTNFSENNKFNHIKNLSLKLDEAIYQETELVLKEIKTNRNRCVNEALTYYNRLQRNKIIAKKLSAESLMVQEVSMKVLADSSPKP